MDTLSSGKNVEATPCDQNSESRSSKKKKTRQNRENTNRRHNDSNGELKIAHIPESIDTAMNSGLLPGEDVAAYSELHNELKKIYRPETPLHVEVVARATALIWRLRRIPAYEAALFNSKARSLGQVFGVGEHSREARSADFGNVLEAILQNDEFNKLVQYEAALRDHLKLVYRELEDITDWHFRFDLEKGSVGFAELDAPKDPRWLAK